jgi:thiol:disulfide interchange protein
MFITGILGGLLALLTPCVFPMIPLTVSFFLRNSDNRARAVRDAFFYGFTIIFSYVVLGLAISMIFGADTLNALATSPGFNLFFFALLIFFAASFFGAFELTMPASWSTALDSKADKTGGLIGVILMGFTFVLVSFSCTGPIVGTLLVDAATGGNVFGPAIGMFGFSLALAVPFSLFAVFPTALKSLPKSGGWMNAVKVVLGFVVLGFSLKFLATADAVAQWGILDREVFIVLWIAISLLLGLYLIGKIKFSHDSDLKYMSVPRLVLAIVAFAFVFYLLPGLWGAPLRAVSSFLPSPVTQDFDLSRGVASAAPAFTSGIYVGESVKEGPHGLMAFTDYEEGMAAAREAGKPVFLDFTGLGCANCRKMEAGVWSDPRVLQRLSNDFVKISLFVDDRTALPDDQQFVSSALGRERTIRTIGQKWSVFQAERYNMNTQPYYVILNHDEEMLAPPRGYDLNVDRYIEFLEEGKNNFTN